MQSEESRVELEKRDDERWWRDRVGFVYRCRSRTGSAANRRIGLRLGLEER